MTLDQFEFRIKVGQLIIQHLGHLDIGTGISHIHIHPHATLSGHEWDFQDSPAPRRSQKHSYNTPQHERLFLCNYSPNTYSAC